MARETREWYADDPTQSWLDVPDDAVDVWTYEVPADELSPSDEHTAGQ